MIQNHIHFDTWYHETADLPGRLLKVNLATYYYTYTTNKQNSIDKLCFTCIIIH